jgi:hypothetical protein
MKNLNFDHCKLGIRKIAIAQMGFAKIATHIVVFLASIPL